MSGRAIWQRKLKVKFIIAEANNNSADKSNCALNQCCFSSWNFECVHKAWNNCLHYGNGTCECCKKHHCKEKTTDNIADCAHLCKHLRQWHKHEARTGCIHTFFAHKYIYGRDNHNACKESNACIEYLNLINWFAQICIVADIWAVCNHNAHCNAQAEEQLTHCVNKNIDKFAESQAL